MTDQTLPDNCLIHFLSLLLGKNNEEWSKLYLLVIILTNSVDTKNEKGVLKANNTFINISLEPLNLNKKNKCITIIMINTSFIYKRWVYGWQLGGRE